MDSSDGSVEKPKYKSGEAPRADLSALRAGMQADARPQFWRSLDELGGAPAFAEFAEDEFPHGPNEERSSVTRRDILKVMAASAALAGLTGCTKLPTQHIVPYVRQPEDILAGQPIFYATAISLGGVASGILVESHMGRPTKIEGNPDHPASLGATDALTQAAVLSLYDPDRSRTPVRDGEPGTWRAFEEEWDRMRREKVALGGKGMAVLTEPTSSPSLRREIQKVLAAFPGAKWYQ